MQVKVLSKIVKELKEQQKKQADLGRELKNHKTLCLWFLHRRNRIHRSDGIPWFRPRAPFRILGPAIRSEHLSDTVKG